MQYSVLKQQFITDIASKFY